MKPIEIAEEIAKTFLAGDNEMTVNLEFLTAIIMAALGKFIKENNL